MKTTKETKCGSTEKSQSSPTDDDPEKIYRMFSVVAYLVVLLLIGFPMWWFTTRVYRADLPLSDMLDVDIESRPNKPYGLPLSLEYDVLITVVNPDPENINLDLNMYSLDAALQPFLENIRPVANFTVKSQFLYFAELGMASRRVDDHFAISEEQLPHIITPLEERIWTNISPRPCINLVMFVPRCSSPLYIYDKNNVPVATNAFLSPRWGGIIILNPEKEACEARKFKPDLKKIVAVFRSQLQKLLGIPGNTLDDISEYKKSKTQDLIDSTKRTLRSLAELLSEISSIVISDNIAEKIRLAVDSRIAAEERMALGNFEEALKFAKVAFENSETAFSDPSLLALLYFPEDQKYAVYIPLFLPIMIPVFMSLATLKTWVSQRKSKLKTE